MRAKKVVPSLPDAAAELGVTPAAEPDVKAKPQQGGGGNHVCTSLPDARSRVELSHTPNATGGKLATDPPAPIERPPPGGGRPVRTQGFSKLFQIEIFCWGIHFCSQNTSLRYSLSCPSKS